MKKVMISSAGSDDLTCWGAGMTQDKTIKISLLDRSLYYKSLMILIRMDHHIHDEEKKMMMKIGKMLGFEPKFCRNTMADILDNNFITDSPPVFSETGIALCFIRDGLKLSAADGQIHKAEITWLSSVAEKNGIGKLLAEELDRFHAWQHAGISDGAFELNHFKW